MTDTSDSTVLSVTMDSPQFQARCRLRFIFYALNTVVTEVASVTASAPTSSGNVLHLTSAAGITQGMTVSNLFAQGTIPVSAVVETVSGSNVTISGSVGGSGVLAGDLLNFLPASHAQRGAFAGALLADTIDHKTLAMMVLASPTNRANCLADPTTPGGTILDVDIDNWIAAKFTGIATARGW